MPTFFPSAAADYAWLRRAAAAALALLPVLAHAAVGITASTGNSTPTAGGAAYTYTFVLTNLDAVNPAPNVTFTAPLPPSINIASTSPAISGTGAGSTSCTTPPVSTNGTIVCTSASLAASATVTIVLTVQVAGDTASGVRTITGRAQSGATANTASVQVNIQVSAPLSITKSGPATVAQGSNIVYQISVNNGGSTTALNATIQDPLPANTAFVAMFGTGPLQNGCTVTPANVVSCGAVDLPPGVSQLTIVARTAPTIPLGNLTNTATITNAGTGSIAVGSSSTTATVVP